MRKAAGASIKAALEARGWGVAFCSLEALADALAELERLRDEGRIAAEVYRRYLGGFDRAPPERLPTASSLLILAAPLGPSILALQTEAGPFEAIIPPTYGIPELRGEAEAVFGPLFAAAGAGFTRARVPLKALAARAGLGRYGRDNILRREGLGSYFRLEAWWTELEAEEGSWGAARELESCASCGACAAACPNGCLRPGNFVVDASRCTTFLNEGEGAFPGWLGGGAHNAAVGCLRCQAACPKNPRLTELAPLRRIELDLRESEALFEGRLLPDSAACRAALAAAEMDDSPELLCRNLRALRLARGAR